MMLKQKKFKKVKKIYKIYSLSLDKILIFLKINI